MLACSSGQLTVPAHIPQLEINFDIAIIWRTLYRVGSVHFGLGLESSINETPDPQLIRRAVALSDLDALRVTLVHLTGDVELYALPRSADMSAAQKRLLANRATDWLAANAGARLLPEPPADQLCIYMEMITGSPIGDLEFAARRDVPGFRDFPFMVEWEGERPAIPAGFQVVVIGSGFAGVGMGVQLDLLGIPYTVLERRAEAGGVWSINRYPDVRVDTASITYEFMFEKAHVWSEYFARGNEVRGYIDHVSRKFGVHAKTRFEHDVTHARFDETRDLWVLDVDTPQGPIVIEANVVVSAAGLYANPLMPKFNGMESFEGQIVHPSRWPDDLDLAGKRVATIGNGSTGVQMLGAIAREAEHVFAFQRTPQWIMPRARYGQATEPEVAWLLRNLPGYANWYRFAVTAPLFDTHAIMLTDSEWQASGGLVNRHSDAIREDLTAYIKAEIGNRPELIEKLVPDYAPFSRRPVVDNGWYRALTRDNVELVTDGIARLTRTGIITAAGTEYDVDVIVSATGFEVTQYLWPMRLEGKGGADLHGRWSAADGPRAYIGMMVPDFPNLFLLYGPNSQPVSGGPAQPAWFATWGAYVGRCLMRMLRDGAARIEITPEAHDRYNEQLDAEASKLVHMSSLGGYERNYYVNREHDRLQVNAPWYSPDFHRWCSDVRWEDLALTGGKVGNG